MSWPVVKLSDVCDEVVEERVATNLLSPKTYVSTDNLIKNFGGVRETDKVPQTGSAVCFREGDILLSNIRPYLRKLWIATFAGGCSNDVIVFRPKGAYERYIFHVLSQDAFFNYVMQNPSGTKMPRGRRPWIKQFPLPLPSLWEQYQIVEELEWKLARLEKIEGNFRAMAETAAQASRSVLAGTFRSLDAPIVKLGDVCDCLDALRIPITKCDRKPGNVPYYGATGIQDYVAGHLFNEPLVLLGEDGAKWGAGERSAFLVEGKSWVNNHVHILRPADSLLASFLIAYLNATDLTKWVSGVTVPKLTQGRMKQIPLPLPSLPDQYDIVEELEWKLSRLEKVERLAREGLTVCEQARRAILAEAFRQADGADVRQDCSAAGQAEPSAQ